MQKETIVETETINLFTDFCLSSNISSLIDLEELKYECIDYKEKNEHDNRTLTNSGGWQSNDLDYSYLEDNNYKLIINMHGIINKFVSDYCAKRTIESFVPAIANSWLNFNYNGNSNKAHRHPRSFFSGSLYINIPDDIDNSAIYFHREQSFHDYGLNDIYSPYTTSPLERSHVSFSPKTGDLLLFPSNVTHGVTEYLGNNVRISLAFNII